MSGEVKSDGMLNDKSTQVVVGCLGSGARGHKGHIRWGGAGIIEQVSGGVHNTCVRPDNRT